MGAVGYSECSARTGEGVADFFESVVRFARQRRRRETGPLTKVRKFVKDFRKKHL